MSAHAVIMAGGGGTRLWPLSRRDRPKPVLRLLGDRSLFQLTLDRLRPMFPADRVLVAAPQEQVPALRDQAPWLPAESLLLEPEGKGTASVIGLAAIRLRRRDPECVMACLPADHYIEEPERFRALLHAAIACAERGDLVTLGITPTRASTGFGYIELGASSESIEGFTVHPVRAFHEKPALQQAEAYLASGRYVWNSGMFIWKATSILAEIERQMPGLHTALTEIDSTTGTEKERETLERVWSGLKPQTIDYGVMEKARRASVFPAEGLGWWDLGSWDRLFEVGELDADGNLLLAENRMVPETRGTLIYQDPGQGAARLIATLGVRDLIVVDTGDVLLICPRERAEEVRRLVESLVESGRLQYL